MICYDLIVKAEDGTHVVKCHIDKDELWDNDYEPKHVMSYLENKDWEYFYDIYFDRLPEDIKVLDWDIEITNMNGSLYAK